MENLRQRLVDLGLFSLDPRGQGDIARKCEVAGLMPEDLTALIEEARASMGQKQALAAVAGLLRGPADELRNSALQLRERRKAPPHGARGTSSSMELVTESNPFGWANPETMRGQDYGEPGAWNPYRQSYNLTHQEMVTAKRTDARRRGCSRWEVTGNAAEAGTDYDPAVVRSAKLDDGSGSRDIYK